MWERRESPIPYRIHPCSELCNFVTTLFDRQRTSSPNKGRFPFTPRRIPGIIPDMRKGLTADISKTWIPELTPEERATLMSYGEHTVIKEDEILILQGQQQDMLFLLLSGELRAQASSHRSQVILGKISPGESVGEMSVMDPFTASATIRALKEGNLWKIERDRFDKFIEENPRAGTKVLRHLAKTMARRVRRACAHLVHQADAAYYDWD